MAQFATHTFHKQSTISTTSPLFVGSFDDNMLCHGPQFVKPIDTSFIHTHISAVSSKRSSFTASILSDTDCDSAILGDGDDEFSEDELPPSPMRRHSGAMSISEEDLPFCLDREALRRETAAHRARQQEHHQQHVTERSQATEPPKQRGRAGTFAAHEQWDSEIDGPSMALWVPELNGAECKRRRTEKTPSRPHHHSRQKVPAQHHVSHIEGPMMSLWEA